jgi:D-alanyl-D-alanine carboxypeptidase
MRKTAAVVLAAVAVLAVPAPAQARQAHPETQAVLNQYLAHAGPGAAVYAGDDTGSWTVTSGTAVVNANRAITPADHFRAASQTKTFTAVLVLRLVDEGLVDLDAPVERYLPGVVTGNGYDGNAISVRQLLNHTSGIARDAVNPRANQDGGYSLAELVRAGLTQAPQFAPGAGWGYSNVNYYLAGLLVERLTGKPYGEVVTSRLIEPLGLTGTVFPAPADRSLPSPYLPGYQGGRFGPVFFWYETTFNDEMSRYSSAGAMTSTQEDLASFQLALADGELVSPVALAEMRELVPDRDYGLGLMHQSLSCGGEAWGHAGDLTTGHSSLTMVTNDGRFASLVTNTFVNNTSAPTRSDVIDSALCEGTTT